MGRHKSSCQVIRHYHHVPLMLTGFVFVLFIVDSEAVVCHPSPWFPCPDRNRALTPQYGHVGPLWGRPIPQYGPLPIDPWAYNPIPQFPQYGNNIWDYIPQFGAGQGPRPGGGNWWAGRNPQYARLWGLGYNRTPGCPDKEHPWCVPSGK